MRDFSHESLSHDPIHGYIPFVSGAVRSLSETTERELIDHPWVQRLRQIHQLQTAWYVFPSAEHSRFQHVLGAMHLASRAVERLHPSLAEVCPDAPSRGYVESLLRIAALLHDVGHGPFGHFFDEHYLSQFGLNHEQVGSEIIERHFGELIRNVRRNPHGELAKGESLDPRQVCYLIQRPKSDVDDAPRWLRFLRSLFCGLYTVDNMDFVLRDGYMSGFSQRAFDLDRLLHYSFFSERGLTMHARGLPALVRFISVRGELFRSIYFHRTVRGMDLTLAELFAASKQWLFPGNPLERLDEYLRFTEWSLLVDVARWPQANDLAQRAVGRQWQCFLQRQIPWKMAVERTRFFEPGEAERSHLASQPALFERAVREQLPAALAEAPLKIDLARHVHRPGTRGPAAGQNFLFDPASQQVRELGDSELVRQIPLSFRICRVYVRDPSHAQAVAAAVDALLGSEGADDATNM